MQFQERVIGNSTRKNEPLATIKRPFFDDGRKQEMMACEHCESLFPKQRDKRFCSLFCLNQNKNKVLISPYCRTCKEPHREIGIYCSKCIPKSICGYCQKNFKKCGEKRFCSQICFNRNAAEVKKVNEKNLKTKSCLVCGVRHSRRHVYTCSKSCQGLLVYQKKSLIQCVDMSDGEYERCANWACRKELGVTDYGKAHNFCSMGCCNFAETEYVSCDVCKQIFWRKRSPYRRKSSCVKCRNAPKAGGYIPNKFKIIRNRDVSPSVAIICNLLNFLDNQTVFISFDSLVNATVKHSQDKYTFTLSSDGYITPYQTHCIGSAIRTGFKQYGMLTTDLSLVRNCNQVLLIVKKQIENNVNGGLV